MLNPREIPGARLGEDQNGERSDPDSIREALQRAAEQAANDAFSFELLVEARMTAHPSEPRAMAEKMVVIALSEKSLASAARIREVQQLGSECDSMADWISVFEERSPSRNVTQSFQGAPPDAFRTAQVDAIEDDTTHGTEQAAPGFQLPGQIQAIQVAGAPRPGA